MIPATEYVQVAKRFQSIFGLNLNDYCDQFLTTDKGFNLDIIRFADYLEGKYPYLADDGVSTQDVVRNEYGEEAERLIMQMI